MIMDYQKYKDIKILIWPFFGPYCEARFYVGYHRKVTKQSHAAREPIGLPSPGLQSDVGLSLIFITHPAMN